MSQLNNIYLELLNNGIYHIYKRYRYLQYLYYSIEENSLKWKIQITLDFEYIISIIDLLSKEEIKNCERIFNAHRKKCQRLKKRIENLLTKPCVFITFTFNDDVLNSTCKATRRKYIQRELKKLQVPYIANIDYGKENEREHYHSIAQTNWLDMEEYELGFVYVERIYNKDSSALSKYINKLTNHSLKETTGTDRLIYSR